MTDRDAKLVFRKKVVAGGTYKDFIAWCLSHNIASTQARYVGNDVEKVQGLELKASDIVRLKDVSPRMDEMLRTRIR